MRLVALGCLLWSSFGVPVTTPAAPATVVIATSRGQASVPVNSDYGFPVLPVPELEVLLPLTTRLEGEWAVVSFADQPFRFLLNAPLYSYQGVIYPLVGGAFTRRDTTYVPLQWLTNEIPRLFSEAYIYDPLAARFEESRFTPVVTSSQVISDRRLYTEVVRGSAAEANGFRLQHQVVVDAGHGGDHPGNLGRFLPRGVNEKHVTLALAKRLRDRLEVRGIDVVMTRDTDTLIDLRDRPKMCKEECVLFVSLHVNSLNPAPGYQRTSGFQTFILAVAETEEAERVARMENEDLRIAPEEELDDDDPLAFILRDLHFNEYHRESFLLAQTIQEHAVPVHPGGDRGVSQALFAVLRVANRPAVLVEAGFATNRGDAAFLSSAAGQERLAEGIAEGIEQYLRQYESKVLLEGGG